MTDAVTARALYDIHEGTGAGGQQLREYVSRAGTVFAVIWRGPQAPDVASLIGGFAARYQQAVRNHRGTHHVLVIDDPDLAMSIVRLPRGWQLQSLLPQAMPAGVSRAEIR